MVRESAYSKPIRLPMDIFMIASATPPYTGVQAALTMPVSMSCPTVRYRAFSDSPVGRPLSSYSGVNIIILSSALLNSGETILSALSVVTAKEISVGGTSISSNVPLMESFPPMAATPSSFCARNAPKTAAMGFPQRFPSLPGFSKYSWKER